MLRNVLFLFLNLLVITCVFANCSPSENCPPPPAPPGFLPHDVITRYSTHHEQSRLLTATVLPGSIKENIKRIAHEQGWPQVVWKVPYDYRWVGQTQIQANSLNALFSQLLADYPLQAVFYHGNHILAIYPRVLKE